MGIHLQGGAMAPLLLIFSHVALFLCAQDRAGNGGVEYGVGRGLTASALHKTIAQIIQTYNNDRPHLSLDMLTPNVAHQMNEQLKKRWKSYYPSANPTDQSDQYFSTS